VLDSPISPRGRRCRQQIVVAEEAPMARIARNFLIVVILALAIELFATVPAEAARNALMSGTWDLAGSFTATVVRAPASADHLPLLLGAIVLLAAMSSSSSKRRRDRW
jgi:chorismate mutase